MGTTIFYLSATGNSLKVAKDLAAELKDTKLIKINKDNIKAEVESIEGRVGILFPVYYYGLPVIVKDFVERLKLNKDAYVFTVATCGGSVGAAVKQLENILTQKGIILSAAFRVIMPDNYQVLYSPPPIEKQKRFFGIQEETTKQIAKAINSNQKVKFYEPGRYFSKAFGGFLSGTFKPKGKDRNFWTDEKCNGCSICSKVCPANNIEIIAGKPKWNHQCEHCLACMHWCPKESIQYKKGTIKRERYHHPDIKVQEMFQSTDK